jgi:O-antigen ligase
VVGAAASTWPVLGIGLIALVTVGTLILLQVSRWTPQQIAVRGLVAFHFVTVLRTTWIDDEFVPIFRYGRIAVCIALLVAAVALLGSRPRVARQWALPGLVIALAGWCMITAPWSGAPARSAFYGGWFFLIVTNIVLVILISGSSETFWEDWLRWLVIGGTVICAISLVVSFSGITYARADRWVQGTLSVGYQGIFHHPNTMGGHGAAVVAAGLALRGWRPHRIGNGLLTACVLLGSANAVASLSRGALLALLLAVTLHGLLGVPGRRRGLLSRSAPGLVLLAGLAGLTLYTAVGSSALMRMADTRSRISEGEEERVYLYRSYWRAFKESPLTGSGFQHFATGDDWVFARIVVSAGPGRETGERAAHSAFLHYGLTVGVPGLILFLAIFLLALRGMFMIPDPGLRRAVLLLFLANTPMYAFQGVNSPGAWGPFMLWVPVLFVGLLPAMQPAPPPFRTPQVEPPLPVGPGPD